MRTLYLRVPEAVTLHRHLIILRPKKLLCRWLRKMIQELLQKYGIDVAVIHCMSYLRARSWGKVCCVTIGVCHHKMDSQYQSLGFWSHCHYHVMLGNNKSCATHYYSHYYWLNVCVYQCNWCNRRLIKEACSFALIKRIHHIGLASALFK